MPLFMEFHKADNLSVADLKDRADGGREILRKFSVRYHQLWINEEAGTVFCLIEGPDRSICESVHRSIYGIGFGSCTAVRQCLDLDKIEFSAKGSVDHRIRKGHGFIVSISLTMIESDGVDLPNTSLIFRQISPIMKKYDGMAMNTEPHIVQGFCSSVENALDCARAVQTSLLEIGFKDFKIAVLPNLISAEENENVSAIRARHMQSIVENSSVILSYHLREFVRRGTFPAMRVLTIQEEIFMEVLLSIADEHIQDDKFNVDSLSRYVGISRPQLYRKVNALTGRSPNVLIRDLRMERALALLKQREKNICEVAFEVGYTNPSYFAKTFSEKYGCTPSGYLTYSE